MVRSLLALVAVLLWVAGNYNYKSIQPFERSMEVAASIPAQLAMAFGDRFLAANVGVGRAIVLGGGQLPEHTLKVLSMVQVDAAWLNPAQEDNYYTANAVLPWAGYVDEAQFILENATASRQDVLPPFMLGFNRFYFQGDADGAATALRMAADKANDGGAREYFLGLADRWQKMGGDINQSIAMMQKITATTRNKKISEFVDIRVQRLEGLGKLRDAYSKFVVDKGFPPMNLEALVKEGYLTSIPPDPTGLGYKIVNQHVVLASHPLSYRVRLGGTLKG